MAIAVVAVHIGLPKTLCEYAAKIADCYKCSAFWAVLAAILYSGGDIVCALVLAVLMSYASHFATLLLSLSQKLYNCLWLKLKKRR
jgi:hypothetical protein